MRRLTMPYADYDVLAKWDSVSFDAQTRAVLRHRLDNVPPRRFLSDSEWELLDAIVHRLMPQTDRACVIPITPWIDDMLMTNVGEGFRYDDSPNLRNSWRAGLAGVDAESLRRHARNFVALDPSA